MTEPIPVHTGGCACGAVRFTATGSPDRVGLCHCITCRKAHAATFNPFVVFRRDQVEIQGETSGWSASPGYDRRFCPTCGSRVVGVNGDEAELSLGSFDHDSLFSPQYESWTRSREAWLPLLAEGQWPRERSV